MAKVNLEATPRTEIGKQAAKRTRRAGFIPAIVYGHGMKPVSLQVGLKAFRQTLQTKAGENVVLDLNVEGLKLKESTCLIKAIQHNPVTDEITHVDFTVISLTEKIQVKVPVVVVGAEEAAGVKEGGVLDIIHHEIEVECLVTDIPEKIMVDVRALKINDSIAVAKLTIPKGVTCLLSAEEVIIAVHPPAKEEVKPVEEGAAPAEPEVAEKGKKPEAGAEAGVPPAKKE
ncbi:MAG TPA: 50S ribosomal protein L25/general stress protein Ctc [bacterium]|nr:50S ribosomal protein L25/general stress protein Ctc [bacterium]